MLNRTSSPPSSFPSFAPGTERLEFIACDAAVGDSGDGMESKVDLSHFQSKGPARGRGRRRCQRGRGAGRAGRVSAHFAARIDNGNGGEVRPFRGGGMSAGVPWFAAAGCNVLRGLCACCVGDCKRDGSDATPSFPRAWCLCQRSSCLSRTRVAVRLQPDLPSVKISNTLHLRWLHSDLGLNSDLGFRV